MRFNVPQFIDIEDTIIGPLTLKQFFLLIGGGLVIVFLWWLFELWFVLLIGVPLALVLAAAILIKINGRPLTKVFSAWFKYWINPRFYIWKKR
ncbi:PrgI family protein [Patescibacteria group bacterium]|nr:PrgI family protein [Patescibacteria group bacterium]MBU2219919.1 PrgI family protein [Patescibacteria group bacterium]MBU2264914.1 PrgI family protein [Patescibacteria group bacterium]